MRLLFTALTAVSLCASGAAQGEKGGLDKLQGTWDVVTLQHSGKDVPKEALKDARLVVKGNEYTLTGGSDNYRGKLTADASKKPKTLDATFVSEQGAEKGRAQGIYELEGDSLKILWHEQGTERPRGFEGKRAEGSRYIVLKRHK